MKNDITIKVDSKTSIVYLTQSVLGISDENRVSNIVFSFENGFVDGIGYLYLEQPDGTTNYKLLTKDTENETYTTPIINAMLTQVGKMYLQLRITKESEGTEIPVFRSNKFHLNVLDAIDADSVTPEEYEKWIDTANAKIIEIDEAITEVGNLDVTSERVDDGVNITITKKDGTTDTKKVNDGKGGTSGKDATINGVNALTIVGGTNITTNQEGSTFTINANKQTDNNYTDAEKTKLAGLKNYDDTEIKVQIKDIQDAQEIDETNISANTSSINTLSGRITTIEDKIPTQATSTNQLADKDFVNSSIATNTANFIGTFNSVAELEAYVGVKTNNDYAFVKGTDSEGNTQFNRYKFVASSNSWVFEYTLNNSSFTANQWVAINSGITPELVAKIHDAIQYTEMPTASADLVGRIVQYIGTTNDTYTNGYFYKCLETVSTQTASLNVEQVMGLSVGEVTYDLDKFAEKVEYIAGTYTFEYKAYPGSINVRTFTDDEVRTFTRDIEDDSGSAYAWNNGDTIVYTKTRDITDDNYFEIELFGDTEFDNNLSADINSVGDDSTTEGRWVTWDDYQGEYVEVDMADYGLSFEITPLPQAKIEVTYVDEVAGSNVFVWQGIPVQDLSEYVKHTDYASDSVAGAIKTPSGYAIGTDTEGRLYARQLTYEDYQSKDGYTFIGKQTLENVITGKELVKKTDTEITNKELLANKTTTIDSSSTDTQYPSAKAVYEKIKPTLYVDSEGYICLEEE